MSARAAARSPGRLPSLDALRLVLSGVLLLSSVDDVRNRVSQAGHPVTGLALGTTMALAYLAMIAALWVPELGILLTGCSLLASLWSGDLAVSGIALLPSVSLMVARRAPRPAAVYCTGLLLVALVASASTPHPDRTALTMAIGAGVAVSVGLAARHLLLAADRATRQAEALLEARKRLADEDRLTFARELHDGVGHALASITLQAGAYGASHDVATTQTALRTVEKLARTATDDLRHLVDHLREEPVGPITLAPMVPTTLARESREQLASCGWHVTGRVDPAIDELRSALRSTVCHFIKEGTANVIRYALPHSSVVFSLTRQGGSVVGVVENLIDPDAQPPSVRRGAGLVGLAELATQLGGTLEAGPRGPGWRLQLALTDEIPSSGWAPTPSASVAPGPVATTGVSAGAGAPAPGTATTTATDETFRAGAAATTATTTAAASDRDVRLAD